MRKIHVERNNNVIYFDHAATTSPLQEVVSIYAEYAVSDFANSSSAHRLGLENSRLLDKARNDILSIFQCRDHEVIFTSGATEANNLVLKGYMEQYQKRGKHLIVSSIEHPSILNTTKHLESLGYEVSYLPVDKLGHINLEELKSLIKKETILVSIMAVNNETGIAQNTNEIAKLLKNYPNVAFHVDAAQATGKVNFNFNDVDFITISLHKIGGLKSSGILIKRKKLNVTPLLDGGGQEFGYRSGTSDLAMALASVTALRYMMTNFKSHKEYVSQLVEPLYCYLESHPDLYHISSTRENPYILNFSTLTKKSSVVVEALSNHNIMVSTHSACSSRLDIGSPTLANMHLGENISKNSIRLSFSYKNTKEEIDTFKNVLDQIMKEIRG